MPPAEAQEPQQRQIVEVPTPSPEAERMAREVTPGEAAGLPRRQQHQYPTKGGQVLSRQHLPDPVLSSG